MKLMPASRAFATIRDDVASSVGPPNIMVPRQIGEIFRPLRPRLRYCMGWVLAYVGDKHNRQSSSLRAQRSNPPRREERMDCFAALAMTWKRRRPQPSLFNILNTPLAIAIQRLSTVTSVVMKM